MAETLLNYKTIPIESLIGPKGKHQKNMRDLLPNEIYEYACEDADITLQLKNVLEPKLKSVDAEKLFWEIEMPLVPVLADMELHGVRLDTAALEENIAYFYTTYEAIRTGNIRTSRRKLQHFKSKAGWRYLVWQTPDYGKA